MNALDNLVNNEYHGANAESLRRMDGEDVAIHMERLEDQIESSEYLLYNLDEITYTPLEKFQTSVMTSIEKEIELSAGMLGWIGDIVEDHIKTLEDNLQKSATTELGKTERPHA